jgi:hypothetical protein
MAQWRVLVSNVMILLVSEGSGGFLDQLRDNQRLKKDCSMMLVSQITLSGS